MKFYLVYKFDNWGSLESIIQKAKKENPEDQLYYFKPESKKKKRFNWHLAAKEKIKKSDCVIYIRLVNSKASGKNSYYKNVSYELQQAIDNNIRIVVANIGTDSDTSGKSQDKEENEVYKPRNIYEEDYLDKQRLKYSVIDGLDIERIKDLLNSHWEQRLFNGDGKNPDTALLLDEFRIMLDTTEKMMDRRQGTNNFYITLCSAVITSMAALAATRLPTVILCVLILFLSVVLVLLCMNWRKTLISYGRANEAKFEVLNSIEKKLPASIFNSEWEYGKKLRYTSYSKREITIPVIFMVAFMIIALMALVCGILFISGVI